MIRQIHCSLLSYFLCTRTPCIYLALYCALILWHMYFHDHFCRRARIQVIKCLPSPSAHISLAKTCYMAKTHHQRAEKWHFPMCLIEDENRDQWSVVVPTTNADRISQWNALLCFYLQTTLQSVAYNYCWEQSILKKKNTTSVNTKILIYFTIA